MEIIMNQFDNYELTTMDYALKYYLEHNEMLEMMILSGAIS